MTPGIVAQEAAAIKTPVLAGVGERDVYPDPRAEPGAYRASHDIARFIVPNMAHMHHFASIRAMLWERVHAWSSRIARQS